MLFDKDVVFVVLLELLLDGWGNVDLSIWHLAKVVMDEWRNLMVNGRFKNGVPVNGLFLAEFEELLLMAGGKRLPSTQANNPIFRCHDVNASQIAKPIRLLDSGSGKLKAILRISHRSLYETK